MRVARWALVAMVAFTMACSDSNEPNDVSVAGTWTANWTNMNGGSVSCFGGPGTLQLAQTGETFTGTYASLELVCDGELIVVSGGSVVSGSLNGTSVTFDLDTSDAHQAGSINGNSMSGTATWTFAYGGDSVTLTGNWSATRQ